MATKKPRPPVGGARAANKANPIPFHQKLVLNQWMLSLFAPEGQSMTFHDLAAILRDESLEGLDANNVHHFHHALTARLFNLTQLPTETLLEYDQNIVKHTLSLNSERPTKSLEPIRWKYFQYLTLLFTEIYLDRFFRDPDALRASINEQITKFNNGKPAVEQLTLLDTEAPAWQQLNKLAFWSATGSGKTLLMHANILQYRHYFAKHRRSTELNHTLLLTPNEGLSKQHLAEFATSKLLAAMFSKNAESLLRYRGIEVLEVTKLREQMGEKTVAVSAFEGNNLVLVDEGHRGTSAGEDGVWMAARNALCEKGFSFEYSATFGQAVKGSKSLTDSYAKSVLFDYSYRYFYNDGFGKDFQILNLEKNAVAEHRQLYLVACLLAFYQQMRLFCDPAYSFRAFNIEKPLWVFVGSSVTAALSSKESSDIVEILQFLQAFLSDPRRSTALIDRVLSNGLQVADGTNLFSEKFVYLNSCGLEAQAIFQDVLRKIFNASAGGQLYLENLKGAVGEIALKVGIDNEPFGVINVGDDSKLLKLCAQKGLQTGDREFSGSLFHGINKGDSSINLLIGSKKFTEGWSSWRVSTLGLMNVGKSEGAQIIQLFGRGVRLMGYRMSLKRSAKAQLGQGVSRPKHIEVLETLNIFGVQADYMEQFRNFLREEGIPTEKEVVECWLPCVKQLGTRPLKTIRLKESINGVRTEFGAAFRQLGPIPTLAPPRQNVANELKQLTDHPLELNWYPKVRAMASEQVRKTDEEFEKHRGSLGKRHIAFLDFDKLYYELSRFKAERGWYNLNLTQQNIERLLADQSWYVLYIPKEELEFASFERVQLWQEIALALLKKYTEHYYFFKKREWELPHLEYAPLTESDPNFLGAGDGTDDNYYRVLVEKSRDDIVAKLAELSTTIRGGTLKPWSFAGLSAVMFDRHLFQPLMYLAPNNSIVEMSPSPLNEGEHKFVEDLRHFYRNTPSYFEGKELYLLRNLSRGKGVGFFEAGNFYPDFIVWLFDGHKQHIIFVDPKSIRFTGPLDPKVEFYKTIKEIEKRLQSSDPNITLDSYVVSNTRSSELILRWHLKKADLKARHLLFQDEDKETYIRDLLGREPTSQALPALLQVFAMLDQEPIESLVTHPAEAMLHEYLQRFGDALLASTIFESSPNRWDQADALRLVGRVNSILTNTRLALVRQGLRSESVEVRDATIQAIELWHERAAIALLREHNEPSSWLKQYQESIMKVLKGEANDAHSSKS